MEHYTLYFGQAYGEGSYGNGFYSCTEEQEQQGICTVAGSGSGSRNGGLADTGLAIVAVVTLACLIVFVGLVVRLWRRPKLAPQEAQPDIPEKTDTSNNTSDSQS